MAQQYSVAPGTAVNVAGLWGKPLYVWANPDASGVVTLKARNGKYSDRRVIETGGYVYFQTINFDADAEIVAVGGSLNYSFDAPPAAASSGLLNITVDPGLTAGTVTISGSATLGGVGVSGATVTVLKNGTSVGTATSGSDGRWSLAGVSVAAGDAITAQAAAVVRAQNQTVASTPAMVMYPTYPDRYYFAALGMRFPNKSGNLPAGQANYASMLKFRTAPWVFPAGTSVELSYPNLMSVEGDSFVNEALIGTQATITAASISYTDAGGTTRVAAATAFTNGGVLSSTVRNGGVTATIPLAYAIPASSVITIRTALEAADGASLISYYRLNTGAGEVARHASVGTTFTAAVNSGASIVVAGSAGSGINALQYGPAMMSAKGADVPSVPMVDGNSLADGKGTLNDVAPDRIAGMVEHGLARSAGGTWSTACGNLSIAGSGFLRTDPTDGTYTPDIQAGRHALIAQITAKNGGYPPFNHIICEHGTNSLNKTLPANQRLAEHTRLMKTRYNWLHSMYPGLPITQLTMTQYVSQSTDGFRTVGGQIVADGDGATGVRFLFNDKLEADLVDGAVQFAVNTYAAVAADAGSNRDKFKVHPYTGTLTRVTTSALELYLNNITNLAVGSAVVIDPSGADPQLYIVRSITTITAVSEYQLTLFPGGSSATMPVGKAIGTTIGGSYTADGDTNGSAGTNPNGLGGIHRTAELDAQTAAWSGAHSWDAWKAAVKTATGWAG